MRSVHRGLIAFFLLFLGWASISHARGLTNIVGRFDVVTTTSTSTTTSTIAPGGTPAKSWLGDSRLLGFWNFDAFEVAGSEAIGRNLIAPRYNLTDNFGASRYAYTDPSPHPPPSGWSPVSTNQYASLNGILDSFTCNPSLDTDCSGLPARIDNTDLTMGCTIWPEESRNAIIMTNEELTLDNTQGFKLELRTAAQGGSIRFRAIETGPVVNTCESQPSSILPDAWWHVVGKLSGTYAGTQPGELAVFINGTPAFNRSSSNCTENTVNGAIAGQNFRIGADTEAAPAESFFGPVEECFLYDGGLTQASLCRICSCGWENEYGCMCEGSTYINKGRNEEFCNLCDMTPVPCNATNPGLDQGATATTTSTIVSATTTTTISGNQPSWKNHLNLMGLWHFEEVTGANALDQGIRRNTLYDVNFVHRVAAAPNGIENGIWNADFRTVGASLHCRSTEPCYTALNTVGATNTGDEQVSIGCWAIIDPAFQTQDIPLIGKYTILPSVSGYVLKTTPTDYRFSVVDNGGSERICRSGVSPALASFGRVPQHIVATWDDTDLNIYVNGTQNQVDAAGECENVNMSPIGRLTRSTSSFVVGQTDVNDVKAEVRGHILDECFMYYGTLSSRDVCRICACGWGNDLCECNAQTPTIFNQLGRNAECNNCLLDLSVPCSDATPGGAGGAGVGGQLADPAPPTTTSTSTSTSTALGVSTTSTSTSTSSSSTSTSTSVATTVTTTSTSTTTAPVGFPDWSTDPFLRFLFLGNSPETTGGDLIDSTSDTNDFDDAGVSGLLRRAASSPACDVALCRQDTDCTNNGSGGMCFLVEGNQSLAGASAADADEWECTDANCPELDTAWTSMTVGFWFRADTTLTETTDQFGVRKSGFFPTSGLVAGDTYSLRVNQVQDRATFAVCDSANCESTNIAPMNDPWCRSEGTFTNGQWDFFAGSYDAISGPDVWKSRPGREGAGWNPSVSLYDSGHLQNCENARLPNTRLFTGQGYSPLPTNNLNTAIGEPGVWDESYADEVWLYATIEGGNGRLGAQSLCRICSCGWTNHRGCSCSGVNWNNTGANAALCNSCKMPALCTQPRALYADYAERWEDVTASDGFYRMEDYLSNALIDNSPELNDLSPFQGTIIWDELLAGTNSGSREGIYRAGYDEPTATGCLDASCPAFSFTADFSICGWFHFRSVANNGWMVSKTIDTANPLTGYGLFFDSVNGNVSFQIGDGAQAAYEVATSANSTVQQGSGVWNHICGVFDDENDTSRLYINGAVAATNNSVVDVADNSASFRINGADGDTNDLDSFYGVDELWVVSNDLADVDVCRVCSCGVDNHRGCECNDDNTWANEGVNVALCGNCTLPTNCNGTAPTYRD